jgi:hypothetical protein
MEVTDPNSMCYWLPAISDLGIPMPKTVLLLAQRLADSQRVCSYVTQDPQTPRERQLLAALKLMHGVVLDERSAIARVMKMLRVEGGIA